VQRLKSVATDRLLEVQRVAFQLTLMTIAFVEIAVIGRELSSIG
jgi:hypothetical protein